uniref:Uncharacterized protein n=1 Tax=Melopsittacus undulatus TaxID=13146 RepID=A0A8V5G1I8_MELUD
LLGGTGAWWEGMNGTKKSLLEKYGFPEAGTEIRCYTNHALSYDQAKRVPRWVIEHISKQKMYGFFHGFTIPLKAASLWVDVSITTVLRLMLLVI